MPMVNFEFFDRLKKMIEEALAKGVERAIEKVDERLHKVHKALCKKCENEDTLEPPKSNKKEMDDYFWDE